LAGTSGFCHRSSVFSGIFVFDAKNRVILGWLKFVSAYVEKDKKILKNLIFAFAPLRI